MTKDRAFGPPTTEDALVAWAMGSPDLLRIVAVFEDIVGERIRGLDVLFDEHGIALLTGVITGVVERFCFCGTLVE